MNIATIMLPIMSVVGIAVIVFAVRFIVKNVKKWLSNVIETN